MGILTTWARIRTESRRPQEDVDPATQERPGIPLGRPGDAREVAELIVFLAGPEASDTTGSSYVIDGGMLLMAASANR